MMPSIYEAEIRHKSGAKTVEDQLTSRVFGTLAMLPKEIICSFLRQMATDKAYGEDNDNPALLAMMNLKSEDILPPINLWTSIEGTYPDVRVDTSKVLIIIEVKKDAEPNKEELVRQFSAAYRQAGNKKMLAYFLLTKGYERPDAIQQAEKELKRKSLIHWRRWPKVWKWFKDSAGDAEGIAKNLLQATQKIMEAEEGMAGQTRFKRQLEEVRAAFLKTKEFCSEVSRIMDEVKNQLKAKEIECIGEPKNAGELMRYSRLDYQFKDNHWEKVSKDKTPHLSINFSLEESEEFGGSVGLWGGIDEEEGG